MFEILIAVWILIALAVLFVLDIAFTQGTGK